MMILELIQDNDVNNSVSLASLCLTASFTVVFNQLTFFNPLLTEIYQNLADVSIQHCFKPECSTRNIILKPKHRESIVGYSFFQTVGYLVWILDCHLCVSYLPNPTRAEGKQVTQHTKHLLKTLWSFFGSDRQDNGCKNTKCFQNLKCILIRLDSISIDVDF